MDAVKATIAVRKENCIIVRGDESAGVILDDNSEDGGAQEEVGLLLYLH
jgi:hypothetical protein